MCLTLPAERVKAAVEGDKAEGVAAVAEGAVALDESKGGERGDEEGGGEAVSALRMSEEEVEKLREEQEARCRELAMNVNVFMPYKVGGWVGVYWWVGGYTLVDRSVPGKRQKYGFQCVWQGHNTGNRREHHRHT